MKKRNWMIVVPIALAVWGLVTERTWVVLLAIGVYVLCRPYSKPRARLTSVPADPDVSNVPGKVFGGNWVATAAEKEADSGAC